MKNLLSRPSRARGLKHLKKVSKHKEVIVAPFAGAWIETVGIDRGRPIDDVAPFAGAWIETCAGCGTKYNGMSRPSRARGLKPERK